MKTVDLFAGCGGFTTGFERAGFSTKLAVEIDLWASETYHTNHSETTLLTQSICEINPLDYLIPGEIDGVIGGPPCQGFSLSGNRDPKDPRNSLFMQFVRFVDLLKPKFFVMENVTGILSAKTRENKKVVDIIRNEFIKAGYKLCVTTLNATDFGVPQSRHRVFFIGVHMDYPFSSTQLLPKPNRFQKTPRSLWDAISDLPQIEAGEGQEFQEYSIPSQNEYQKIMREGSDGIRNHISMRHTSRLVERFSQISYGQSVKDVSPEHGQRKRGSAESLSGKVFSQNNMRPYPNQPSPTVPASFQSNFIHPHLNRNFTAREGARLQSFPDRYVFCGKRTTMSWEKHLSQYQQIGNAVPPLLAEEIGNSILQYFNNIKTIVDVPNVEIEQLSLF